VLFVALAGEYERHMIEATARIAGECDDLGIPFIAEAEFPTTYARVEDLAETYGVDYLLRNVRLCAELGADIVKTNWPGSQEAFARLVDATSGVPVVLAGGSRITDQELLSRMEQAVAVGAIGCSVGRNIFMHDDPRAITHALSRVIRERWPADKAHEELESAARPSAARPG
jgi:DhnA family fructose-bisphosphate aldolase class Ia